MLRRIVALCFVVLVAACSTRSAAPTKSVPDAFPPVAEVRAERGVAHVSLDVTLDPVTNAPTFLYEAVAANAPVIRVRPGETIAIDLHNAMPVAAGMQNAINLHFHGLTVAPAPPGDETIATMAMPGHTLRYRVTIPRDHDPGLYWYHPHIHGQGFRMLSGGMSGAIVVEGIERHLPAIATMKQRVLVLRDIAGARFVDDDLPRMAAAHADGAAARARPQGKGPACRAEGDLTPTINRLAHAAITIGAGERQFFRIVNASASRFYDLRADGMPFDLVALDGIPLDRAPGVAPVRRVSHLLVPPAGRAEFVLTGTGRPAALRSACYDAGPDGDAQPAVAFADLVPGTPAAATPAPLVVGAPLTPNDYGRPLPAPARTRTVTFSEDAAGFYLNGRAYTMGEPPRFVVRSGTVERWRLLNASDEVHVFHLHQVHFTGGGDRAWRDTVVLPRRHGRTPSETDVTIDFRNPLVRGAFFFHCHLLDHEDGGMMAVLAVR